MPHTEGEWKVTHHPSKRDYPFIVTDDKPRKVIAQVIGDGVSGKGNNANAQLIAAAPDLLEAAQKIDNCMAKIRQPQFHRFAHANDVLVNALGDLHKAIAKATGEET